ncbi:NACHT domain-containing protein [Pseudofrankia sp. BMG5.36]|uniref:NACHT domain-containing protein n=1 Tax=Pseudofrankia sp. BMG5.36 TaxID=1834512 RepID=UPI000AA199A9|nr:NACHT domain-containing protein [Pseudofrankia sp. BMG5.36]
MPAGSFSWGIPGGGKTTLSTKLMYEFCENSETGKIVIPFLVVLREYNASREEHPVSIVEFISSTLKAKYQVALSADLIESLLEADHTVIIFDGLDELLEPRRRQDTVDSIEAFSEVYPRARILVTSRRVGYMQAPLAEDVFSIVTLDGFDDSQVESYVRNWFALDERFSASECQTLSSGFVRESRLVSDLTRNPLMLALMCSIYKTESYIPRNRPDVYEKCSRMLFDRWDKHRGLKRPLAFEAHVEPAMMDLAYWIYSSADLQAGVQERLLVEHAADYLQTWQYESRAEAVRAAREFIEFCRGRAWVFTDVGLSPDGESLYQFTHRTFLEYFTAYHLAITNDEEELFGALSEKIMAAEWDVVAQLAIQIKSKQRLGGADRAVVALSRIHGSAMSIREKCNVASFLARSLAFLVPSPAIVRSAVELVVETHLEACLEIQDVDDEVSRGLVFSLSPAAREIHKNVMTTVQEKLEGVSSNDPALARREVAISLLCHLNHARDTSGEWNIWAAALREQTAEKRIFSDSWRWAMIMRLFTGHLSLQDYLAKTGKSGITDETPIPGTRARYLSPISYAVQPLLEGRSDDDSRFLDMAVGIGDALAADETKIKRIRPFIFFGALSSAPQTSAGVIERISPERRIALVRVLAVCCVMQNKSLGDAKENEVERQFLDRDSIGVFEFARPLLEHRSDWLVTEDLDAASVWSWASEIVDHSVDVEPADGK